MKRKEKKELGFTIPENYFENFEASMQHKIGNVNTVKTIPLTLRRKFYVISSIAAMLIVIVTLINSSFNPGASNKNAIVNANTFKGNNITADNESLLLDYYISDSEQDDLVEYYLIENALTDVLENQ